MFFSLHHCVPSFQEHVWDASHYLVRLVFNALKEMFTGTREIQVGSAYLDFYFHLFWYFFLPFHTFEMDSMNKTSVNYFSVK